MYNNIYIYIYVHIQGLQVYARCWPLQEDEMHGGKPTRDRVVESIGKCASLLLKITLHVAGGLSRLTTKAPYPLHEGTLQLPACGFNMNEPWPSGAFLKAGCSTAEC